MIATSSFYCNSPFQQFKACISEYFDLKEISYDDNKIKKLWLKYGEDILAWLDGEVDSFDLNWDSEVEVCKALLGKYVDYSMNYSDLFIDFETYWKDLMYKAIMDNIESFNHE